MALKFGLPILALALLAFAIFHVIATYPAQPSALPPQLPPQSPFNQSLVATGVVESHTGNVAVAAPMSGIVAEVLVQVGSEVSRGMPLFRLDDRSLQADLKLREARLASAKAQLERLEKMPRADEVAASAARVAEAQAHVAMQQAKLERGQVLLKSKLAGPQEVEELEQGVAAAKERLARAQAEDRLLRAGTWEADKAIARAAVAEAEALVGQGQAELKRLTVDAPVAGTILQVNIRAGESVGARPGQAPIVMGGIRPLHVRVELPEHQVGQFHADAAAQAVPRGQPQRLISLRFVRLEPLIVPKRVLSGDVGELSDIRVLPVIYAFDPGKEPIYVGQIMDVFIAK